jgi:hypothetical protein
MDGTFVVARGTIAEVLEILSGQELIAAPNWALARLLRYLFRCMQQFNRDFAPARLSRTSYTSPLRLAGE